MSNEPDFSIWLIAKMAVRLLLVAIAAKASGGITPLRKVKSERGLFRVECGAYSLLLSMRVSDPSPSLSSPPSELPLSVDPASTSTETTIEGISPLPPGVSSFPGPSADGYRGRGLTP